MSEIGEAHVSFRLIGDAADPRVLTERLSIAPTHAHAKGDVRVVRGVPAGQRGTGVWLVDSTLPQDAPLEEHLQALLAKLEAKADVIQEFRDMGYAADFYCGLFLEGNGGTVLSSETLARIAALGADLGLDIYYVADQEEDGKK